LRDGGEDSSSKWLEDNGTEGKSATVYGDREGLGDRFVCLKNDSVGDPVKKGTIRDKGLTI